MTHSSLTSQIKLSRQNSSRNGAKVDTFLIHHQAGTNDDATIRAMQSGSRQVSANYTISNEGRITLVVDEALRAWTSGSSTDGGKGAAWDRRAITVEIENQSAGGSWPISAAARRAAARLLNDLRQRYGIKYVLGHRDLWARYGASYATFCPGPEKVGDILALAKQLLGDVSPLPPVVTPPSPTPEPSYDFAGGAGKGAWKGIQKFLAREWGYSGLIDGVPGKLTWLALQKYLAHSWTYAAAIDGEPGRESWKAAQRWLTALWGYRGDIDGIPGPQTAAALTKAGGKLGGTVPAALPRTQIDGVPGLITWRRGQTFLARSWGYTGKIDGIPGKGTWAALQRFLAKSWKYTGRIDGLPGKLTYSALQRFLRAKWGYKGRIDGDAGPLTWAAFQRFVNSI